MVWPALVAAMPYIKAAMAGLGVAQMGAQAAGVYDQDSKQSTNNGAATPGSQGAPVDPGNAFMNMPSSSPGGGPFSSMLAGMNALSGAVGATPANAAVAGNDVDGAMLSDPAVAPAPPPPPIQEATPADFQGPQATQPPAVQGAPHVPQPGDPDFMGPTQPQPPAAGDDMSWTDWVEFAPGAVTAAAPFLTPQRETVRQGSTGIRPVGQAVQANVLPTFTPNKTPSVGEILALLEKATQG